MPRYATVQIAEAPAATPFFQGNGSNYVVQTSAGVLYCIYIDTLQDVVFKKSADGGLSWSQPTTVFAGSATAVAVWYDRWSNISADLIHLAYSESATDDTLYRTIDAASSDALSTQTSIFAGASTANGGMLSITRAVGGNVYCRTTIDNGAEGGFFRLPNANVPNGAWDAARTINEALAGSDSMHLVPGFAADNQDIMGIFWDSSASEISRQIYDDSANTWAETSIAASMTQPAATGSAPHFAVAVDIANSRTLLAAWSAVDTANADLRCWTITESAISETSTNVVLNSTDDQGLCAIALDTANDDWYVFYGGKSDGSETFAAGPLNVYMKASTDAGATWSPETRLTNQEASALYSFDPRAIFTTPRFTGEWSTWFYDDQTLPTVRGIADRTQPRALLSVGVS